MSPSVQVVVHRPGQLVVVWWGGGGVERWQGEATGPHNDGGVGDGQKYRVCSVLAGDFIHRDPTRRNIENHREIELKGKIMQGKLTCIVSRWGLT